MNRMFVLFYWILVFSFRIASINIVMIIATFMFVINTTY